MKKYIDKLEKKNDKLIEELNKKEESLFVVKVLLLLSTWVNIYILISLFLEWAWK